MKKKLNTPEKKRSVRRRLNTITKAKTRLTFVNKKLKEDIKMYEEKLANLTEGRIEEVIERLNISSAQAMVMREIIHIAKYEAKHSRRYSPDWVLMCLLLNIRGPAVYNFLLANEILPLPCARTIKRRLSAMKIECGFDAPFFDALKKILTTKTEEQKHGVLIFDEIAVRKALKTDLKTMRYQGVVNFGEQNAESTHPDELADHALVFSFSSLGENYFQTIGCFGAKGATGGTTLAKLILQAILLLEKSGAKVDGIICDGATTNRKMWREFGISGTLGSMNNFFKNPFDENRKIYAFSDMPHLFKCIRNRLKKYELMVRYAKMNSYINCFRLISGPVYFFLIVIFTRHALDGSVGDIMR